MLQSDCRCVITKGRNIKKRVAQIYLRIRICSGSESSNSPNKILKGQSKMDNPEKLATYGTQIRRISKQKHNTTCVRYHYTQTNTNNENKTWALLQTTGGKDEPNIVLCGNRNGSHNTELRTKRHIILT